MPRPMSETSFAESLRNQKNRYLRRPDRAAPSALPDECVEFTGCSRKHLIKVLGGASLCKAGAVDPADPDRSRPPLRRGSGGPPCIRVLCPSSKPSGWPADSPVLRILRIRQIRSLRCAGKSSANTGTTPAAGSAPPRRARSPVRATGRRSWRWARRAGRCWPPRSSPGGARDKA